MPLTGSTYAASGYVPCGDGWRNSLHAIEPGEQQHYASFGDGYYLQRHTDNGILVLHRSIVGAHLASPGLSGQRAIQRGGTAYDDSGTSSGIPYLDGASIGVHVHCESRPGFSSACAYRACYRRDEHNSRARKTKADAIEGGSE